MGWRSRATRSRSWGPTLRRPVHRASGAHLLDGTAEQSSQWATSAQSDPSPGKPNPNQPYGCTYGAGGPQATASIGVGGPQPGQWVVPSCRGPGLIDPMPPIWVTGATEAAATAQVNPVLVAQQAVGQLGLGPPTIEMAPPDRSPQFIGVATWLWIDPGWWRVLTASVSAGPVTVTARESPLKVVWNMGGGDSVTCDGQVLSARLAGHLSRRATNLPIQPDPTGSAWYLPTVDRHSPHGTYLLSLACLGGDLCPA